MSVFKFASLAHPDKYGYAFDRSAWSSSTETNSSYRQYETYGDGLTQHSNDWPVLFDNLTDYLASLAVAMLANNELVEAANFSLRRAVGADKIAFAAGVVWKETDNDWAKRRYFSVSLQKMGNKTKEHDKRFTEVGRYHDGSRAAIFRMVCPEYPDGFERYQIAEAIDTWAAAQTKYIKVGEGFPEYFNGDHQKLYSLQRAVQACRYVVEAKERREWAQGSIDNYMAALERAARKAAEVTDAA